MLLDEGRLRVVLGGLGDQILNGIADLVRVVNKDNEVVFVNDAMKELLGGDKEKLTCSFPFDNSFLCNPLITLRSLQTGEIIQREEAYEGATYSVKTSPIWDRNREIVGAVEVFRNKTREKKLQNELIEKNRLLTKEMAQAKSIQESLLPGKGYYGNVKVDYLYRPSDTISGDMLDVFSPDGEHLCFYISDTVGHGFASGMTTMFIRQAMRSMSLRDLLVPSRALEEVLRRFRRLNLDLEIYFTMFYGVYHKGRNRLYFSNAGHNCPPLKIGDHKILKLEITGRPISRLFEKGGYEDYYVNLFCSDRLLLHTDGIIESSNEKKENFGMKRLLEVCSGGETDLLATIEGERSHFSWGEQTDDISALLLTIY